MPFAQVTEETFVVGDLDLDSIQLVELLVILASDYGLGDLFAEVEERSWEQITLGGLFREIEERRQHS